MDQERQQLKQEAAANTHASRMPHDDGTWLLITSTMGLTLGYVRIDDHDHELTLAEIRNMIADKLLNNHEFIGGWNFGTGWPLNIVRGEDESAILARNILPSVTVLSSMTAQHIINTSNPMNAATALQYGLSPMSMNGNYMQMAFPQTAASSAGLQPLPLSAVFTPLHPMMQHHNQLSIASAANAYAQDTGKMMERGAQDSNHRLSANTVALLQPHESIKNMKLDPLDAVPAAPTMASNTNIAQIPSLPPFSPPMLTQMEMEQKSMIQKAKLLNLLPIVSSTPTQSLKQDTSNNGSNQNSPQNSAPSTAKKEKTTKARTSARLRGKTKPKLLPLLRLKPVDADGNVIEGGDDEIKNENDDLQDSDTTTQGQKGAKKRAVQVTEEQQQQLWCPECNKKFDTERGYRLHMSKAHNLKLGRGRNKERRFQCDTDGCGRCFYQRSDLRRHQRVHLGLKPFKCSACHKEFTQRGSLYRHVKINHKGQDPKQLTVLQTAETLPTTNPRRQSQSRSQSQEEQDGSYYNEDTQNINMIADLPPLVSINSDNLPPSVLNLERPLPPLVSINSDNLPPSVLNLERPLPPLEYANEPDTTHDDVEIKMEEQVEQQADTAITQ